MSTDHIVALLVAERDRLTRAIDALQGPVKRRGRPPKTSKLANSAPVATLAAPAKKRNFSEAQRAAQAQKMKAYWKKRKASEAKQ